MAETHLLNSYEHSIDEKGRMAFPSKLRCRLGETFIITIGFYGCLFVYSNDEWDVFVSKIKTLTGEKAKIARLFLTNACEVKPDSQGRIMIPQRLKERAEINHNVTVTGAGDRVEIWSAEKYNEFYYSVTNEMLEDAVSDLAI